MKKIMFSDKYFLTKAVLERRKTQTRRIIDPQPTYNEKIGICWKGYAYGINLSKEGTYNNFISGTEYDKSCKRHRVGEIVAISQSYKDIFTEFSKQPNQKLNISVKNPTDTAGWTNKMFVRPELMPHQIRITKVRVERLQDISDEDCLAEGIRKDGRYSFIENVNQLNGDSIAFSCNFDSPREAYAELIDKIIGKGTFESNPYVWVYDFELIKYK